MAPEFLTQISRSNDNSKLSQPIVTLYERPGLFLSKTEQLSFVNELREVAMASLHYTDSSQLPDYQCLAVDDPSVLSDKLIAVGLSPSTGRIIGFMSSVVVEIPNLAEGFAIHAGLACINPKLGAFPGLSKRLTSAIVEGYFRANSSVRKIWVTNRSTNLSTLGLFAQTVQAVFPSPFLPTTPPTSEYLTIATAIASSPSRSLNVAPAELDPGSFLVRGRPFQPGHAEEDERNKRYRAANPEMWRFYRKYLDDVGSNAGDGVVLPIIQVGYITPPTLA
ncbi:hypothetical protein GYMLUDRAFT_616788 [Collybiopsis luxurians FD-317 M1]|uniref:Uncharacterized protein n=1 Tax=Collybiopsis luxurians FD-317 M1 TaxID=944289 RepID=A0A0D0B8W8_9AGAR|nr:hypothetical protein GYMLUDRAFT_616788 [Collybiopsis luxurians FD-317 M1]